MGQLKGQDKIVIYQAEEDNIIVINICDFIDR